MAALDSLLTRISAIMEYAVKKLVIVLIVALVTVINIVLVAIAIVAGILLALFIANIISKPLTALTAFMQKAASTGNIVLSDQERIAGLGRASSSALKIHRALLGHPLATPGWLAQAADLSPATANKALRHLESLGIVRELTTRKRRRLFRGGHRTFCFFL